MNFKINQLVKINKLYNTEDHENILYELNKMVGKIVTITQIDHDDNWLKINDLFWIHPGDATPIIIENKDKETVFIFDENNLNIK